MIRDLLSLLIPQAGRFSPSEAAEFGRLLRKGAGWFGVGPVVVLVDLPPFLRKADPAPEFYEPSPDEINTALQAREDGAANTSENG